jgi:hypothetical protein
MQTVKYIYWQEDDAWLGYLHVTPIIGPKARHSTTCKTICGICTMT